MIFDAHVHMGYYSRQRWREPFYYSPRRVLGVLDRCGVDEFVASSTCAQVASISIRDLNREAREMKRLAGARAHVFLWVSGRMLEADPQLKVLDAKVVLKCSGEGTCRPAELYEGIKLHEMETPWVGERPRDLERILAIADERGLPVLLHSASEGECSPKVLARLAERFPNVRFDFAHCPEPAELAQVIADHSNVWTDVAYRLCFENIADCDWHGRLMFGTDLPVWQAHEDCGLTERYRQYVDAWEKLWIDSESAFRSFIGQ